MSVAKITREFVKNIEDGQIFTFDDIPTSSKASVAIELSRLFKKGLIKKVSKGRYFKPKIRVFGEVGPSSDDKISKYLDSAEGVSYETGFNSFRQLGLTTQISKTTTIATNKPYRKVKIDNINLKFVPKRVDVKVEDIYLLQILDAIKDIKKIPATTPSQSFVYLKNLIEKESSENQIKLTKYAKKYTPRTKALLGAILKELGNNECAYELKDSLNALTTFKLDISSEIIKDKKYWNIV
jgi:predicted transcriptional regulator of viral defense system